MKHMKLIYNQSILLPLMLTLNIYHFKSNQSQLSKLEFRFIKILILSNLQCINIEL